MENRLAVMILLCNLFPVFSLDAIFVEFRMTSAVYVFVVVNASNACAAQRFEAVTNYKSDGSRNDLDRSVGLGWLTEVFHWQLGKGGDEVAFIMLNKFGQGFVLKLKQRIHDHEYS